MGGPGDLAVSVSALLAVGRRHWPARRRRCRPSSALVRRRPARRDGLSSSAVLGCCAVTDAAAIALRREQRGLPRAAPVVGLVGCPVLALTLPVSSVAAGSAVLGLGALLHALRRRG